MGMTEFSGKLTTHVLDTAKGGPASGLVIELWQISDDNRSLLGTFTTNSDGRIDQPILGGVDFGVGDYELLFFAGDYLRSSHAIVADRLFLDLIPIRFGIDDANQHYHVPLLLSPYGYSTYRGS